MTIPDPHPDDHAPLRREKQRRLEAIAHRQVKVLNRVATATKTRKKNR